jgi:hypothetical protein
VTATLYVSALDPRTGAVREQAVKAQPPRCDLWFEPLPGASAIQVLLRAGKSTVRAEFEIQSDGPQRLRVDWNENRILGLMNDSRSVFVLPADPRYAPPPPLEPARNGNKLDLLFLIDGTAKVLNAAGPEESEKPLKGIDAFSRLLGSKSKTWAELVQKLVSFASGLAKQYRDIHTCVLAFGDHDMRFIASAPDLLCRYILYPEDPEERKLSAYTKERLEQQLMDMPSTSGGDFVDALGEGLEASARCGWRRGARHLLLLAGDSPGYSLLKAAPQGADIHVRHLDVAQEAMRLHVQHAVEILSIYLGVPASADNNPYGLHHPKPFLDYTRNQYRRLTSLPSLFWDAAMFEPQAAFEALQSLPQRIARHSSYGILVPEPASAQGTGEGAEADNQFSGEAHPGRSSAKSPGWL